MFEIIAAIAIAAAIVGIYARWTIKREGARD